VFSIRLFKQRPGKGVDTLSGHKNALANVGLTGPNPFYQVDPLFPVSSETPFFYAPRG